MANERRIRLIQVAKEFNVGINTITDFLQKKGVKSDGSPNALVDAETYALLEKEFGAGRAVNSERVNIRERIAQKQATVTLDDDAKGKGGKNDEELLVKSNVISVKDEVASMGPKILGKIDLSGKGPRAAPAATPAPAPRPVGWTVHGRAWRSKLPCHRRQPGALLDPVRRCCRRRAYSAVLGRPVTA